MRVRLEDVCEKESSKLKQSDVIDQNGLYPVYGASGYLGNINTYQQSNYYIAVVKDGAGIGRTMLLPPESSIIGTMQYLIPKDNVLPEYLYYVVKAKHLEKYFSGATIPHIYFKDYKNEQFDLVSFEEQRVIINRLKKIEIIIDNLSKNLLLLDELVRARFVEMFGDPNIEFKYSSVKFNDLVARMTKGPFGSDMKKDLFVPKGEDTYKVYIQINAIQKNQSLGEYYISKEYFDRKVSRFELFPNDYIITCDGTLGKYLKLDENMEKGVISPSLLRLTLQNDKINDKYFENIWDFYMLGLMKKEARNACLVHLPSAKKIGEILIPVPPLELQNQFASFVEEVDKSRLLSNHSLFLIKSIIF